MVATSRIQFVSDMAHGEFAIVFAAAFRTFAASLPETAGRVVDPSHTTCQLSDVRSPVASACDSFDLFLLMRNPL